MSIVPVPSGTAQGFDEDAWDDLLNYIEERRVIPIVGPDLLRVNTPGGPRLLYEWLAEKLAVRLSVDTVGLPRPLTLNDVLCCYLGQRGRREEAYTRLRSILREVEFEPPMALRQLAQITDFNLFVSTTFDPLLEQAVNLERYGLSPTFTRRTAAVRTTRRLGRVRARAGEGFATSAGAFPAIGP